MASASTISAIIRSQFQAGPQNAICVLGEPGIGKTAIQEEVFRDPTLKFDAMLAFNASFRDVVDFLGTPTHQDDGTTKWFPPSELVKLGDGRRWLLVLEEITDCEVPVQNALCRLIHEREVNGVKLGDNVYILANGNLAKHKSGARSLITKLSGRMTVVEMEASFPDWKNNFAIPTGVSPMGIAYLNFAQGDFCDFKPNEMVSATPRSWTRAFATPDMEESAYIAKISGDVGPDKAAKFAAFKRLYASLPRIEDILADPTKAAVPSETDVQYALAGALSHHATRQNFGAIVKYISRFPTKDLEVVCVMDAMTRTKGTPNEITSTPVFADWALKNAGVFG